MRYNYSEQELLTIQEHSFRNYHVKGFDYVCLFRSGDLTEKIYFFDGDVSQLPEVVNPHNHRYDFITNVISGAMRDYRYQEYQAAESRYNRFNWRTPLNGGSGFEFVQEVGLIKTGSVTLTRESWPLATYYHDIHTIQILKSETVIRLLQLRDQRAIGTPSQTYFKDEPPALDGLYEKFTMDALMKRLQQYHKLINGLVEVQA